ncbi:hypothetical protein M569_04608 [Genlisea aurea]|uniref:Myb/SANT-like domain-containing protein n=1 Tax=Genlisea aurea TaxID=192259 RepID=S8CSB7_9LAMI|nr:hypothetical protein M569_04608 [Genlisea aurea]
MSSGNEQQKERLVWTVHEEDALISGFHAIMPAWKCDNGFRTGFLQQLEKEVKAALPVTHIKARPHILNKYKTWKREYGLVASMVAKSGVGFNSVTKMLTATDELWNEMSTEFPERKKLRKKTWSYFDSWSIVLRSSTKYRRHFPSEFYRTRLRIKSGYRLATSYNASDHNTSLGSQ